MKNVSNGSIYPSLEVVPAEVQPFLIGMYSLTSVLSLVGNVTVVAVLLLGKRSSKGIRHFLVNLAVSDIVMAVFCIPFTYTTYIFGDWVFELAFCPVANFMQLVTVTVSVYTLTAIGVDRYVAIMHPLQFRWTKSYWPVVSVLGSIWTVSIALSSIVLVYGYAEPYEWDNVTHYDCREHWPSTKWETIYTVFVFVVTFALPLTILAFTYSSIAWKMWKHTSPGNADADRDQLQLQAKTKVIKMLSLVVFLFALCWCPLHIYLLLLFLDYEMMLEFGNAHQHLNNAIFLFCHWLAMANSFVNPIVYCFMNDNFWSDLRLILRQLTAVLSFHRKQQRPLVRGRCLGSFRSTTYVLSFRTTTGSTHGGAVCLKKMSSEKPTLTHVINNDESFT